MLALCRKRAAARELQPVLHQQALQTIALPRRYRTIFVACGTLHLVVDRAEVVDALHRLHDHLLPGGAVVLTAFAPWMYLRAEGPFGTDWHPRARTALPDGTELVKEGMLLGVNKTEQTAEYAVRYRRLRGDTVLDEQVCPTPMRWYYKHELSMMLEQAGLQVTRCHRELHRRAGHGRARRDGMECCSSHVTTGIPRLLRISSARASAALLAGRPPPAAGDARCDARHDGRPVRCPSGDRGRRTQRIGAAGAAGRRLFPGCAAGLRRLCPDGNRPRLA